MIIKYTYIPKELLHIILEYDGRIKFLHKNGKNGKYVNIIHKKDKRYNIIKSIISKKLEIMKTIEIDGYSFYFEFRFDICNRIGLCYDYNFSYKNQFEICYFDTRNGCGQIRTYL
jgi:hypothetical protein